jgi:hypothetical protein
MSLNKIRRISGVFLETMFLVFIVVYSWADIRYEYSSYGDSSTCHAVVKQVVLRNAPVAGYLDNVHSLDWDFTEQVMDFPGIKVVLAKAFFIADFERNTFYIFTFAQAP